MGTENGSFRIRAETRIKNARLVALRESFGMTLKDFAQRVGIGQQQYCGYETMRLYPSPAHAEKLAELIGCDVETLFPESLKAVARGNVPRVAIRDMDVPTSHLLSMSRKEVLLLPDNTDTEAEVDRMRIMVKVRAALPTLTPIECRIIRWYFGLDGEDEHTLEEIGANYGLSRTRIQQLREQALHKIRNHCKAMQNANHAEI